MSNDISDDRIVKSSDDVDTETQPKRTSATSLIPFHYWVHRLVDLTFCETNIHTKKLWRTDLDWHWSPGGYSLHLYFGFHIPSTSDSSSDSSQSKSASKCTIWFYNQEGSPVDQMSNGAKYLLPDDPKATPATRRRQKQRRELYDTIGLTIIVHDAHAKLPPIKSILETSPQSFNTHLDNIQVWISAYANMYVDYYVGRLFHNQTPKLVQAISECLENWENNNTDDDEEEQDAGKLFRMEYNNFHVNTCPQFKRQLQYNRLTCKNLKQLSVTTAEGSLLQLDVPLLGFDDEDDEEEDDNDSVFKSIGSQSSDEEEEDNWSQVTSSSSSCSSQNEDSDSDEECSKKIAIKKKQAASEPAQKKQRTAAPPDQVPSSHAMTSSNDNNVAARLPPQRATSGTNNTTAPAGAKTMGEETTTTTAASSSQLLLIQHQQQTIRHLEQDKERLHSKVQNYATMALAQKNENERLKQQLKQVGNNSNNDGTQQLNINILVQKIQQLTEEKNQMTIQLATLMQQMEQMKQSQTAVLSEATQKSTALAFRAAQAEHRATTLETELNATKQQFQTQSQLVQRVQFQLSQQIQNQQQMQQMFLQKLQEQQAAQFQQSNNLFPNVRQGFAQHNNTNNNNIHGAASSLNNGQPQNSGNQDESVQHNNKNNTEDESSDNVIVKLER